MDEMVFGVSDSEDDSEDEGAIADEMHVVGENGDHMVSTSDCENEGMDDDDNDVVCHVCKMSEPPDSNDDECKWVECDYCDNWFHFVCAKVKNKDDLNDLWKCESCTKILSFKYY